MSIHEHLPPEVKRELKQVGWTKGLELAKLARNRDSQSFDCATWLHKARVLPKERFRHEVEKELLGSNDFRFSSRQYCPARTSHKYRPSSTNLVSFSASLQQPLRYSERDSWDRMLEQGIQMLDRFCQEDRIRVAQPRMKVFIINGKEIAPIGEGLREASAKVAARAIP
jgi:hypothetical protein